MGFPLSGVSMGGFPQSPNYLTSSYCPKRHGYLPWNKAPGPFGPHHSRGQAEEASSAGPMAPPYLCRALSGTSSKGPFIKAAKRFNQRGAVSCPITAPSSPSLGVPGARASALLPAPFSLPSPCLREIENSHQGLEERNTKLMGTREPA